MEEFEDPTESLKETVNEHAMHAGSSFTSRVAVTTAFLAVLAAVSSMLSGHHANEAMIEQIKSSDKWAYYQAKGIKAAVTAAKIELLTSLGKPAPQEASDQHQRYKEQQEEISKEATEREEASEAHLQHHMVFARAVTLFQVAIAISAIAALSRRRPFWYFALVLGVVGCVFLGLGFR
ncbi:MAG: DUF4337 domain-containing protein [Proteobacteria bacterium]|nr:DUF4337 domain-containing protein [Pseudomonadota bacterium]